MRRFPFTLLVIGAVMMAVVAGSAVRGGHPAAAQTQGQLREFTLVAEPVRWEIQPGLVVDGWGYNGQVPGPTLRVTEGDRVRVTLVNHLPEATTIHWHGIDVPQDMDGVPGLSQEPVEPGESFVYEFVATNPGTRMYHTHYNTDAQMQLGLMGAFIIDPRTPQPEKFDREFTYLLSEKALDVTPDVALGEADVLHRDAGNGRGGALQFDLFLMNGRAATGIDPMSIAPGEKVRVRLINLGNLVHAMHLHGHSFRIIATDGNPVPPAGQWVKDTINIAPGERYDFAVEGTNPGVWMFHCHINNHAANGMTTVMAYDGVQPPVSGDGGHGSHGPSAALPAASGAQPYATAAPSRPQVSATPAAGATSGDEHAHGAQPVASATPAAGQGASAASSSGAVTMLDDRFGPTRVTVTAGTTVTWANTGRNLHTTTSFDGVWDSGSLQHDDRFSFTFDTPGTYQYFCRQHFFQGMRGAITVLPPS